MSVALVGAMISLVGGCAGLSRVLCFLVLHYGGHVEHSWFTRTMTHFGGH